MKRKMKNGGLVFGKIGPCALNTFRLVWQYLLNMRKRNKILVSLALVWLFYWNFPSLYAAATDHSIPQPYSRIIRHPNHDLMRLIPTLLIKQNRSSYLTVVAASHGHLDLTLNWIEGFNRCFANEIRKSGLGEEIHDKMPEKHLEDLTHSNFNRFLVIAMDYRIYNEMLKRGVPSVLAEDLVLETEFLPHLHGQSLWREKEFILLSRLKLHVLLPLMKYYAVPAILFSDVDIVIKNSSLFSYLDSLPEGKQIAITSDNVNYQLYMCSCFYMIRNTPSVVQLYEDFRTVSLSYRSHAIGFDDQELMNRYIVNMTDSESLLFRLPMGHFPNGQALDEHYPSKVNATPWIVHANYRIGQYNKICFLHQFDVWFLAFEWWYPWRAKYEFYLYFGVYQAMNYIPGLTMWTMS